MPLYVHPSSTCDICLDPFSIRGQNADSDASKTPHTISCGHIFCRSCLLNILPFTDGGYPSCPHCRKPYRRDKIKALFVALDPENDRPTPGGVLDAIRRADAAASKIRRAENEILPHDLMQSLESVHNFIQAHPSLNLPIEQLVDAFATAMDKYADKSRTLSDYEYRNRRHTLEDQEENSRKEALEESYLDEIQALQNEFRKLGLPMNNIHLPVPPEARKRPSEVRDHAPTNAATSINSSSTQSLLFSSRDEVQRRVQIRADLRRQRPESDRPPRGDVIESGNALGLDGQDDSNRPARRPETQIAGRLLFEGRIVNREEDSTETAPEASLLGVDRREPHYGSVDDETISLPRRPIPQNGEMGPPLSRPMRRASTGASHLLAHGSNQIVAEHRRDISDPSRERQRERHVHTNHHQQGAVHYDGRSSDGSSRQRSSSRHVQYDLPSVIPQIPDSVIPSIQRARNRSPASADIASRHPEPTQNIMSDSRAGRSRAPSMNRSVSLQPPVVESEYETPRISAPVTPGSSVHPTPYNSSPLPLHPSPNVAPYVSIPVPDPSRSYDSPYPIPPPLSRTADQTPHQPIRSYTDGRSRSGTGDLLNPPPLWDPAGLAPIPVPHVHPAATARIPQPPPVPVSAPPLRRNDTLLF